MKVLQVLSSVGKAWGGPPRVVLDLCRGLQSRVDITLLSTYEKGEPQYAIPEGIQHQLYQRSPFSRFWFGHAFGINHYLREHLHNFDLVHLHELWSYPQFLAGRMAIKRGIPVVISPHGHFHPSGMARSKWKKIFFRHLYLDLLLKKAEGLVVLSEAELQFARPYVNEPEKKIHIIPNGIDPIENSMPAAEQSDHPYLVFVSRIHPQKGLELFLQAYADWPGREKLGFKVAGPFDNPAYESQIRALVKRLGLTNRVQFLGPVFGQDKQLLLSGSVALVLTSVFEGLPTILLEGLQLGKAMIISDQCGIDQLLEREGIAVVCTANVSSIRDGLKRFAENSGQLKLRAKERGPELVDRLFSLESVSDRYFKYYSDVCRKKG